jgi:hypothetical protein
MPIDMLKNNLARLVAAYLGCALAILGNSTSLFAQKAGGQPRVLRITDAAEIQALRVKHNAQPTLIELASWIDDQPERSKAKVAELLFSELPQRQIDGLKAIVMVDAASTLRLDSAWYDQAKQMIDLQPSQLDWICNALIRLDPRRALIDMRRLYEIKDLDPTYRLTALAYLGLSQPVEEVVPYLQQVIRQNGSKKQKQDELFQAKLYLMRLFTYGPAHMRSAIESFFLQEIKEEWAQGHERDIVRDLSRWPSKALSPYLKKMLDAELAADETLSDDFLLAYAELNPIAARPYITYALSMDNAGARCIPLAWKAEPAEGYQRLRATWASFPMSVFERVKLSFELGGEEMARQAIMTMEADEQQTATTYLDEHLLPLGSAHPLRQLSAQFYAAGILTSPMRDEFLDSLRTQNEFMIDWAMVLAKALPEFVPEKTIFSTLSNTYTTLGWTEALRPRLRNLLPEPYEELMCRGCKLSDVPLRFTIWRGVAYGCEDENGHPCNRLQDLSHLYNLMLADAGVQERLYLVQPDIFGMATFLMRPPQAKALFKIAGIEPL